jgi:serine/threonine kinase 32
MTEKTTFVSKIEYNPPEYDDGYEFSVDYWRLGICIYKLLTGEFQISNEYNKDNIQKLNISIEAKKILEDLLTIDQFKRLGSRQNGAKIKEHAFFNEIDWLKLEQGQLVSPFKEYLVNNYYYMYYYIIQLI